MLKNFVGQVFSLSHFQGMEKLYDSDGNSQFSVEFFLSQSAEIIRGGNFQCCISEHFRQPKNLCLRGDYDISVEYLVGYSTKNFRR